MQRPNVSHDNIPLAVATITAGVFALSLGDALIKLTSNSFVLWQVFVLRSCLALVVLLGGGLVLNSASLQPLIAPFWTTLRSLLLVIMWIFYYIALPHIDLSIAAAAFYTLPLFITLFSAILGNDTIGKTGWIAVILGFAGILMILRPSAEGFNTYALLPLGSAMLYAVSMILTRTKCRGESALMLSLALNVAFVVVGGIAALAITQVPDGARDGFLLAHWTPMGASEWLSMTLLAAAILIGSLSAAYAYQKAPPATVGTFDFAYVGFSVLWGLIFFAEIPDLLAGAGIALICVAGILSLRA